MINFLVPVDFSDNSLRALEYASGLAERSGANVIACHVQNKGSFLSGLTGDKQKEGKGELQQKMDSFLARITYPAAAVPETILREGDTVEEVLKAIDEYGVSLVVMGTAGGKTLKKRIFGTTAEAIAKGGICPVLVLPENGIMKPLQHIVYAADFENGDQVTAMQLIQLKDLFHATLTFLHVKNDKQPDYIDDNYIKEGLMKQFPKADIHFVEVRNDDIAEGISNYVKAHETSLLAFTILNRNYLENLTHSSVSSKLLHSLNMPMLALPENGVLLELQKHRDSESGRI
ncbi:universal stress protein [Pontibacter toksunensis]|uniref:Universal stress protein n=1 Tax=Pontibacter toksunensis TaxID=1332631 RepID=A0ABW6BY33_9BACT